CSACFGDLNTDMKHRVTLSGIYRAPYGINMSGIFRYHSATPYTEWTGVDSNHDGFALELPAGVGHVNTLRGSSFSQLDFRIAKAFRVYGTAGIELIGEVFNLFNSKNEVGFRGRQSVIVGGQPVPNPAFGTPSAYAGDPGQGEQRLAQLGLRVTF